MYRRLRERQGTALGDGASSWRLRAWSLAAGCHGDSSAPIYFLNAATRAGKRPAGRRDCGW
jgi:hypothetical protein